MGKGNRGLGLRFLRRNEHLKEKEKEGEMVVGERGRKK